MAKRITKRHGLIPVSSVPKRTDTDGRKYHCQGELARARELRLLLRDTLLLTFSKQPEFELGDQTYKADFFAVRDDGIYWAEEFKGGPYDERFRMIKRLWAKYGPCKLVVIERPHGRGPCKVRETIAGKAAT